MNESEQPQAVTERIEPTSDGEVGTQVSSIAAANESSISSNGSRHSVELHIEELVLHGFEPAHRYAIGEAIERELTRLFTEHDAPAAITYDGEIAHLDGGTFQIDPDSRPETIGARVAQAIYGGLGK